MTTHRRRRDSNRKDYVLTVSLPGTPDIDMAYADWAGPPGARTVVCVHGLTRNSHDFDTLARKLSKDFRVVCPDMPGRGASPWLDNGYDYHNMLYVILMIKLCEHLGLKSVDWVGTSMGGAIAMQYATDGKRFVPIRRLVLNDTSPLVPKAVVKQIAERIASEPTFSNVKEVEQYLRRIYASFGRLTDRQWAELASHSYRTIGRNRLALNYDPKIGDSLQAFVYFSFFMPDIDLWYMYDAIDCPTLLLRGAESEIVSHDVAMEMKRRGPRAKVVEFAGIGHAPALMSKDQIEAIRTFLLRP